jgi:putative hydroxymethylpyrimidine transport system substrate-binding protein
LGKQITMKKSLLLLLILISTQAHPLKKITLHLDWYINSSHAPIFVAQEKGYFKEAGIEVEIIPPNDPTSPSKLVATDSKNLAIALDYQPQYVVQRLRHWPITEVGTLISTPLDTLTTLQDYHIHTLQNLKGKRIGYSESITGNLILGSFLKKARLKKKDIHLINVHYGLLQALLTHRVDAVMGLYRNVEVIQLKDRKRHPIVFYPEKNGFPEYSELIFVVNSKNANNPLVRHFFIALEKGVKDLAKHPEENWKLFAKVNPALNTPLNHKMWQASLGVFALHPGFVDKKCLRRLERYIRLRSTLRGGS